MKCAYRRACNRRRRHRWVLLAVAKSVKIWQVGQSLQLLHDLLLFSRSLPIHLPLAHALHVVGQVQQKGETAFAYTNVGCDANAHRDGQHCTLGLPLRCGCPHPGTLASCLPVHTCYYATELPAYLPAALCKCACRGRSRAFGA